MTPSAVLTGIRVRGQLGVEQTRRAHIAMSHAELLKLSNSPSQGQIARAVQAVREAPVGIPRVPNLDADQLATAVQRFKASIAASDAPLGVADSARQLRTTQVARDAIGSEVSTAPLAQRAGEVSTSPLAELLGVRAAASPVYPMPAPARAKPSRPLRSVPPRSRAYLIGGQYASVLRREAEPPRDQARQLTAQSDRAQVLH
jgi:hypothetical protein